MFIQDLAKILKNEIFGSVDEKQNKVVGVHCQRFNPGGIFSVDFFRNNGADKNVGKQRGARVIGITDTLIRLIHKCMNHPDYRNKRGGIEQFLNSTEIWHIFHFFLSLSTRSTDQSCRKTV